MLTIRTATLADAAALLEVYRPFVEHTSVSFETEPPSLDEFTARVEKSLSQWAWLIAEVDGRCAGYAYGSTHRERPAYRYSVEVSAYLHEEFHRRGIGSALYTRLLDELTAKGFCTAFAGITLPNDASVALHTSVGFEPIGVFKHIGWKFGQWHDVAWLQRRLRDAPAE